MAAEINLPPFLHRLSIGDLDDRPEFHTAIGPFSTEDAAKEYRTRYKTELTPPIIRLLPPNNDAELQP